MRRNCDLLHSFTLSVRASLSPLRDLIILHPRKTLLFVLLLSACIAFYYCLPSPLFQTSTCTVLYSREGTLLSASIADDGQYRFPALDSVPEKFTACVIAYEDRYFYWHWGINPVALSSAFVTNLRAHRIVRGGSTLTMQVARMMHPGAKRSYANKLLEILWAVRLECSFSKREILALYASYAPFGGNVVGLEAAAWRYYQTKAENLSWGQMAALAVLPNAPANIYPGRLSEAFRKKRDKLLQVLYKQGTIDAETLELSLLEPLPEPPDRLPQRAWQLVNHAYTDKLRGQNIRTTLAYDLQCEVERLVEDYASQYHTQLGRNFGVLVADVESGDVLAYVGNVPSLGHNKQGFVNMITAKRSTGSIIKPFLYAGMLDDGLLLPNQLVPDLPIKIGTFAPENASHQFTGAVRASHALARSLNIPSVHMLREYGIEAFLDLLKKIGATTFNKSSDYYGLPLILGGGESTLWEQCAIYASMARTLNHYTEKSNYYSTDFRPLHYLLSNETAEGVVTRQSPMSASAIYLTFKALREVGRPEEEVGWRYFSSTRAVAWKTGTSWGSRDAWAIGVNKRYVVGVWNGNATGEGQPDLSGVKGAAPLMFRIWGILPRCEWFAPPLDDMRRIVVCKRSGMPPTEMCEERDTIFIPNREYEYPPCPYHQMVHLDETEHYRVNASCYPIEKIHHKSWFVLPPAMAWFYSKWNPTYQSLPAWMDGCNESAGGQSMQFIYPRQNGTEVSIPRDLDGKPSPVQFELAHARPESTVYWHLDDEYLGRSVHLHQMFLLPEEGEHTLTVVDDLGERTSIRFTVVYRAK